MDPQRLTTLRKTEIPAYLHSSALFESFSDEPDDKISIPQICLKLNLTVNTVADLKHLLQTMQYWILPITLFPKPLVEFLVGQRSATHRAQIRATLLEFESTFPGTFDIVTELHNSKQTCYIAAKYGRIDFLEYFLTFKKPVNIGTLKIAVAKGHTEVVDYIFKLLVSRGHTDLFKDFDCIDVIRHGHLNCLKFLVDHGAALQCEQSCLKHVEAINCRQLACLEYLFNKIPLQRTVLTVAAVQSGDIAILQCVLEHGCPCNECVWKMALEAPTAACLGYLLDRYPDELSRVEMLLPSCAREAALVLLLSRGVSFHPTLITTAAQRGNIELLRFLHKYLQYDCFVASTMAAAAGAGQEELVKGLHAQGCPWDDTAPTAALREGRSNCLSFLIEQRGVPQSVEFKAIQPNQSCRLELNLYAITKELEQQRQLVSRLTKQLELVYKMKS